MKDLKLTNVAPEWFIGIIKFFHKGTLFGEVKIKKPLKWNISLYVFLFSIMEDSFEDKPELQMWRFWKIFETSMVVNWKEITEKQIMDMFWGMFIIKFSKL